MQISYIHRFLASTWLEEKIGNLFLGITKISLPIAIAFLLQITMSGLLNIQFSIHYLP